MLFNFETTLQLLKQFGIVCLYLSITCKYLFSLELDSPTFTHPQCRRLFLSFGSNLS